MNIIAIDTSCDETAVAVTSGRWILANAIYSQILIHKKWGGVVPHLAKRAHEERIDMVIEEAIKKAHSVIPSEVDGSLANASSNKLRDSSPDLSRDQNDIWEKIDYIAVTYGPGLAPALEVGIKKTQELAKKYKKKIIPVNHMEGHIYSVFGLNSVGNPKNEFEFPYLCLLVSGGHTELVIFKNHNEYEIIGETIDDAAGEALDKAAKMLGLGYPGGPVIEQLAKRGDITFHKFPRPYIHVDNLNFSFSGLKTSFFYFLKKSSQEKIHTNISHLAATFQDAVFSTLVLKLEKAMQKTSVTRIIAAGGVMANADLRKRLRTLVKKYKGQVLFPTFKTLYGDNAAMIGIAAHFKEQSATDNDFDRVPRARLGDEIILRQVPHQ